MNPLRSIDCSPAQSSVEWMNKEIAHRETGLGKIICWQVNAWILGNLDLLESFQSTF